MSEQPQDIRSLTDTAGVDLENSALDIASWEIGSWEIESASDFDDLNCSVGFDQNILSPSCLVEEIEDLEGSDDDIAGLTGSTTIYPGAGLDFHEEYFSRYIGSTLTHLTAPANEQGREDSISMISQRIRNLMQDQCSLHPVFFGPSPPSQTVEKILASPARVHESPTETSSSAVETKIVPKKMVVSDTVSAVRADYAHLCCEACMRNWLEMENSLCTTCRAYLT